MDDESFDCFLWPVASELEDGNDQLSYFRPYCIKPGSGPAIDRYVYLMNETREMTEREVIRWLTGAIDADVERTITHLEAHILKAPVMYFSQIERPACRTGVSPSDLKICLRIMAREGKLTFDGEVIRMREHA